MRLRLRVAEQEAETTRRRQRLLVGREQLQQLELFQRGEARSVLQRPHSVRRGGAERTKEAIAALVQKSAELGWFYLRREYRGANYSVRVATWPIKWAVAGSAAAATEHTQAGWI
jgi:hypothetical protein